MKKYYFIPSENKTECFIVEYSSWSSNGINCYYGRSTSTKEEVWIYYDDGIIEYFKDHRIVHATEIDETKIQLYPNQYMWGGEISDKRRNSLCARPYFKG